MEAYLNQLDKYFVDHMICARIDRLIDDAAKLTRVQLKQWYEGIDNDITQGMLAAECKV
jgi:hypothetical protein